MADVIEFPMIPRERKERDALMVVCIAALDDAEDRGLHPSLTRHARVIVRALLRQAERMNRRDEGCGCSVFLAYRQAVREGL